ncbi:MAG: hypothetical protein D6788_02010 [Planctomycetota bacterium]|nr:MAG: hypothetical protein D6788_02010 [Planctomycetota bacterium]
MRSLVLSSAVLLSARVAIAQTDYDFHINAGVDRFAYGVSIASAFVPPTTNNVPNTEFVSGEYSVIGFDDEFSHDTGVVGGLNRAAVRFTFTISEAPATVTQLEPLWKGGQSGTATGTVIEFWIWNWRTSVYDLVGSTTTTPPPDAIVTTTYTTTAADYINSATGQVILLVTNAADNNGILTNYVRVRVFAGGCSIDADCNDNDPCTVDTCNAGACQNNPVDCSAAGDQCNTASCDPAGPDGNCNILTPVADGTVCDDGVACTDAVCSAGSCVFSAHTGQVTVNVEVEGISNAVTRNVTFTITPCGGAVDTRVVPLSLDAAGLATAVLSNVDATADWLAAQEGHTLRRSAALTFTNCAATVDFTGASRLIAGDFQTTVIAQDNLVDITDFSILAARLNQPVDPVSELEADATANGMQGTEDFAAIQPNFFIVGDAANACPLFSSRGGRVERLDPTRVRVREMSRPSWRIAVEALGFAGAERADLTGDGYVDLADVRAFARLYGLRLDDQLAARISDYERTTKSRRSTRDRR